MRFFERKFSLVILFFSIPLLFLPKINLMRVDAETAGLRIDDLILFFIGILLMWSHALSHQKLYKIEGWILLITGFSFLSFFINRLLVSADILHMEAKIFYTIRLLEYFIFFYIGALAFQHFRDTMIIRAFFVWNLFIMLLQKGNVLGAITVDGYRIDVSTRAQGIASFPSEMGLILNLLFCYMIYDTTTLSRFVKFFPSPSIRHFLRKAYPYWMFCLFGILIIFTGNRISILALLVCFAWRLKKEFNIRSPSSLVFIIIFMPFLVAGIIFLMTQTAAVYQRSVDLFSLKNLELIQIVWEKIDLTQNPIGNEVISATNYDMSWWLRIHKWIFVLKAYLSNPACYLQGLGPGFAWSALDGGILRIIIEYGWVGTLLFGLFFASLYRINTQIKWMMIAFLMNMIFFDAHLAYKTMSLLLFIAGYAFEKKHGIKKFENKKSTDQANLTSSLTAC